MSFQTFITGGAWLRTTRPNYHLGWAACGGVVVPCFAAASIDIIIIIIINVVVASPFGVWAGGTAAAFSAQLNGGTVSCGEEAAPVSSRSKHS